MFKFITGKFLVTINEIDPNLIIDNDYILLNSVGSHLFKAGLGVKCRDLNVPTSKFDPYKKYVAAFLYLLFVIRCIISLCHSDQNERLFIYIGDISYFIPGIRIHFNIMAIGFCGLCFVSQVLHWNKNNYPWLLVFKMMSGFVSPSDIGLNDVNGIKQLLNRAKVVFCMCKLINKMSAVVIIILVSWTMTINYNLLDLILFGIPWFIFSGFHNDFRCQ